MIFFDEVKRLVKANNTTIEAVMNKVLDVEWGAHIYQGWRRRGTLPRIDIGYKIAKELGVTVEHFFEETAADPVPARLRGICKELEEFSPKELEAVKSMIISVKELKCK